MDHDAFDETIVDKHCDIKKTLMLAQPPEHNCRKPEAEATALAEYHHRGECSKDCRERFTRISSYLGT